MNMFPQDQKLVAGDAGDANLDANARYRRRERLALLCERRLLMCSCGSWREVCILQTVLRHLVEVVNRLRSCCHPDLVTQRTTKHSTTLLPADTRAPKIDNELSIEVVDVVADSVSQKTRIFEDGPSDR